MKTFNLKSSPNDQLIDKDALVKESQDQVKRQLAQMQNVANHKIGKYISPLDEILLGEDSNLHNLAKELDNNNQDANPFSWDDIEDITNCIDINEIEKKRQNKPISDEELRQAIKECGGEEDIIIDLNEQDLELASRLKEINQGIKPVSDEEILQAFDNIDSRPVLDEVYFLPSRNEEIFDKFNENDEENVDFGPELPDAVLPSIITDDDDSVMKDELKENNKENNKEDNNAIEKANNVNDINPPVLNEEMIIIDLDKLIDNEERIARIEEMLTKEINEQNEIKDITWQELNESRKAELITAEIGSLIEENRECLQEKNQLLKLKYLILGLGVSLGIFLIFTLSEKYNTLPKLEKNQEIYYPIPNYPVTNSVVIEEVLEKVIEKKVMEEKITPNQADDKTSIKANLEVNGTNLSSHLLKISNINENNTNEGIDKIVKISTSLPLNNQNILKKERRNNSLPIAKVIAPKNLVNIKKLKTSWTRNNGENIPDFNAVDISSPYVSMNFLAYLKHVDFTPIKSITNPIVKILIDEYKQKIINQVNLVSLNMNTQFLQQLNKFYFKDNYTKAEWEEIVNIISQSLPAEISNNLDNHKLLDIINLLLSHSELNKIWKNSFPK